MIRIFIHRRVLFLKIVCTLALLWILKSYLIVTRIQPPRAHAGVQVDVRRPVTTTQQHIPINPVTSSTRPTFVLILAYCRSGSSLIGDLFNQDNRTFYAYEPLHSINMHGMGDIVLPDEMDKFSPRKPGSHRPDILQMTSESTAIIDNILTCRLARFQHIYFMRSMRFPHSKTFSYITQCWLSHQLSRKECMYFYEKLCHSKTLRVIKTIRVNMSMVENFMAKYENFKVLHLLRDPRGSLCSFSIVDDPSKWRNHCNRVQSDIIARKQLEVKYPGRFLEVVYEKFAEDPFGISEEIYDFVGVEPPPELVTWLYDKTMAGNSMDGKFGNGTSRADSIKAAYKWVYNIQKRHIQFANMHCSFLLKHGKFMQIDSTDFLKIFTYPKRNYSKPKI